MNADPVDQILGQWQRERPDLDASPMGVMGRIARLIRRAGYPASLRTALSAFANGSV
jgi:hypothetical protein